MGQDVICFVYVCVCYIMNMHVYMLQFVYAFNYEIYSSFCTNNEMFECWINWDWVCNVLCYFIILSMLGFELVYTLFQCDKSSASSQFIENNSQKFQDTKTKCESIENKMVRIGEHQQYYAFLIKYNRSANAH